MLKKKFHNLKIDDQRRIYNTYIETNKEYKQITLALLVLLFIIEILLPNSLYYVSCIFAIFIILLYLALTKYKVVLWYENKNYIEKKNVLKMFRKKHYNELNRNEKMIVQEEYKKDENYSVLMTYIFYLFVFESVVAFIKGLIIPSDLFYILFVILIYLIYDLSKIKKWYERHRKTTFIL